MAVWELDNNVQKQLHGNNVKNGKTAEFMNVIQMKK